MPVKFVITTLKPGVLRQIQADDSAWLPGTMPGMDDRRTAGARSEKDRRKPRGNQTS
jgi:hypothetical protein